MRWLILALSLGTTLATLWRGIALFLNLGTRVAPSSPTWVAVTLCVGSLFGFIGGVLAFNHKMISLLFLYLATIMTFLYPPSRVLAYSFAVISVLTTVYLIMYQRSKYKQRYGYSAEEYVYEEADKNNEDDEQGAASKSKMPKRRSLYSTPQKSDTLIIKPPQRQRETKVCLSCGIDVPTPYKYCPLCGMELYTSSENKVSVAPEDAEEDAEDKKDETIKIYGAETQTKEVKSKFKYHMFDENKDDDEKYVDKSDESYEDKYDDKSDVNVVMKESSFSDKSGEVEVVPVVRKTSSSETSDIQENSDTSFKPLNAQSKKQRNLEVDSSYQSFGRYTQSRKKRKVSTFQRTILALLAVVFVGAVGSFMYRGINRVPPPERIDIPITRILPEITEDITSNLISTDTIETLELAIPNSSQNLGALPYMEVVQPTRVITTGNSVNLRENHTTTSRAITRIQANNTFTLLEQWKANDAASLPSADRNLQGDGKWYKVQSGNNTGWIYGQFALPLDGRSTSLPGGYTDALLNSFGSNRDEIERRLGNPRQQARGDTIILEYTGLRITLRQNRVQNIQISGRGHSLLNGLAVGMAFDEVTKIIGTPNRFQDGALSYLETANRGIVIRRENNGNIRSITVGSI